MKWPVFFSRYKLRGQGLDLSCLAIFYVKYIFVEWLYEFRCSVARQGPTLCDPMDWRQHTRLLCPPLSLSLLKFMSTESVTPSNQLVLCCPLLLLPSIFSSIRIFPNKSALHIRWPKYLWVLNTNKVTFKLRNTIIFSGYENRFLLCNKHDLMVKPTSMFPLLLYTCTEKPSF